MMKIFRVNRTAEEHLTAEEIDGLLDESLTADGAAAHMRSCVACAGEVAAMREALGCFRQAMTGAAEAEVRRWEPVEPAMLWKGNGRGLKRFWPMPAYFALAATVVLAAVLIPLERPIVRPAVVPVVETVAPHAASPASQDSDDALLEEIDQQVSASVPSALEPLEYPADAADTAAAKISGGAASSAEKRN